MSITVKKFGGSSVGSPDRIRRVAERIKRAQANGQKEIVVVVSAMGDTTDDLIALAEQVSPNRSAREMDMLLATGEQVSIALLAMALADQGVPAVSLTGAQAGITTEPHHSRARIIDIDPERVKKFLAQGKVVVVAGFQGETPSGELTTLGRGGSDTTAVALACALNAPVCEIYTDVDGVYTSDPRIVPNARKLKEISYDEMLELASLGAQVLHPRSVEIARQHGVAIQVLSSFHEVEGTWVKGVSELENILPVSGVTVDMNQAKIIIRKVPDIPGVAGKIFGALADAGVNVDMIIQSLHGNQAINDIAFTVPRSYLSVAVAATQTIADEIGAEGVQYSSDIAKVSIVGVGMAGRQGIAASMFQALAEASINIQMISTSEIKISCVVTQAEGRQAALLIHEKFRLGDDAIVFEPEQRSPQQV